MCGLGNSISSPIDHPGFGTLGQISKMGHSNFARKNFRAKLRKLPLFRFKSFANLGGIAVQILIRKGLANVQYW